MREEKVAIDVFNQICQLFRITSPKGYEKEEVEAAKMQMGGMPKLLEQFYLEYGSSPELQDLQDELILPNQYTAFLAYDYLVFFDENLGSARPELPLWKARAGKFSLITLPMIRRNLTAWLLC